MSQHIVLIRTKVSKPLVMRFKGFRCDDDDDDDDDDNDYNDDYNLCLYHTPISPPNNV
jgi:hypothetical protein